MKKGIKGPKLGTKLILMGLVLLSIPWLGYRYLLETRNFLLEGQAQAQLLTSKGIAITLQSNTNLFNDLPLDIEDYETLPTYPLDYPIRLDGYQDDWRDIHSRLQNFGEEEGREKFKLLLGVTSRHLYAYLEINDRTPIYRHPGYRRLDNSDHLRLNFIDQEGREQHLLLTMEGPGAMTAYYVGSNWLYAERGQPEYDISGYIRDSGFGYKVELRIPLMMIGPQRRLGIVYADVGDTDTREVSSLTGTLPQVGNGKTNLVLLRSPAIEKVITELNRNDARIWILDRQQRVRATAGTLQSSLDEYLTPELTEREEDSVLEPLVELLFQKMISPAAASFEDFNPQLTSRRDDQVISSALSGTGASRQRASLDGRAEIITTAYPITERDKVIGAVVLEQSTNRVLTMQRQSLENIVLFTAVSLLAIMLAITLFSVRLAWRVQRMRRETGAAIDPHGRLMIDRLRHETGAGDEIGDLARSVSGMLSRLHQYQSFVANIPRTLRHEINNPLNTISTSLENLSGESDESQRQLYLQRAKRGLHQISLLVQQLAESASLEQALMHDELEKADLNALLVSYLSNYQNNHPDQLIKYQLPDSPVWIDCTDFRIEQLLDKLLDNAFDFADNRSVTLELLVHKTTCEITVSNRGPTLDDSQLPLIFDLMSSSRPTLDAEKPHLGLGLYISRLIVDYHSGSISIANLPDQSGVAVRVLLPLKIS